MPIPMDRMGHPIFKQTHLLKLQICFASFGLIDIVIFMIWLNYHMARLWKF